MKSAIIVAGGSSVRYGKNKLNEDLLGETVLDRAVDAFVGIADQIVVVTGSDYVRSGVTVVKGGETRFQSVLCGLNAVSQSTTLVAIHDGARPFVSRKNVEMLFEQAEKYGSAVPCTKVAETLYNGENTPVCVNRENYFTVQTPQVFNYQKLLPALTMQGSFTDESSRFLAFYGDVHFVESFSANAKITYSGDLPDFKVGNGFDVHAFGEGSGLVLGGVNVPYNKKLVGHSDADVVLHAICDAVLSACGAKDIGVQFPDTDDKYLGISSSVLLKNCLKIAEEKGYEPLNVTAVVICQQPKMTPFIEKMQNNVADLLGIAENCVGISATTTEKLGALGNGDGIACQATALLIKR